MTADGTATARRVPLCADDEIPEGEGRSFSVERPGLSPLAVLVVHHQGEFRAYENRCAHFALPLNVRPDYTFVRDGAIVCQVHYARYAPEDGRCLRGDCDGEGLRPLRLTRHGTQLELLL